MVQSIPSFIDFLKNYFNCDVLISNNNNLFKITNNEKNHSGLLQSIYISNNVHNILVIDLQKANVNGVLNNYIRKPSQLDKDSNIIYAHLSCDGIIIKEEEKNIDMYFMELKTSNPTGAIHQLKSSYCIMKYMLDIYNDFYMKNNKKLKCRGYFALMLLNSKINIMDSDIDDFKVNKDNFEKKYDFSYEFKNFRDKYIFVENDEIIFFEKILQDTIYNIFVKNTKSKKARQK